jgi:hypothetical protein
LAPWTILSIAIIAVTLVILALVAYDLWKKKKEDAYEEPDYYSLFVMGLIWFPCGGALMIIFYYLDIPFSAVVGLPFFVMGSIYLVIGLVNRKKWKNRSQEKGPQ